MNTATDPEKNLPEDIVSSNEATFDEGLIKLGENLKKADEYVAAALQSSKEAAATQLAISASGEAIDLIKAEMEDAKNTARTKAASTMDIEGKAHAAGSSVDAILSQVEQSKKSADDTVAEIIQAKATSDTLVANATTDAGQIQTMRNLIEPVKLAIDEHAKTIVDTVGEATESNSRLKALADTAQATEEKIAAYERRLAELEEQCVKQLQTITDLLPGAGSAGLASAFEKRQDTFDKPAKWWQWLFIGTVILLILIAASGAAQVIFSGHMLSNDELLRGWIIRLPIVGGLIWLALHASHEAALAKRLEEDYGYKATIAASFLAFHNHLMKITAESKDTPLEKLCSDTLLIIATPPGRIYEKHELTTSLTTKIGEAVATALNSRLPKPPAAS